MINTTENTLYQIMQFVQEQHRLGNPLTSDIINPFLNRMLTVRMVPKDGYITTVHTPIKKSLLRHVGVFLHDKKLC